MKSVHRINLKKVARSSCSGKPDDFHASIEWAIRKEEISAARASDRFHDKRDQGFPAILREELAQVGCADRVKVFDCQLGSYPEKVSSRSSKLD